MYRYLIRRFFNMVIALVVISFVAFAIIQLPPGDYLTSYVALLRSQGEEVSKELLESLRVQYGLDKSFMGQYVKWATNFVRGDMGYSFRYELPVNELVWERIGLTFLMSLSSVLSPARSMMIGAGLPSGKRRVPSSSRRVRPISSSRALARAGSYCAQRCWYSGL